MHCHKPPTRSPLKTSTGLQYLWGSTDAKSVRETLNGLHAMSSIAAVWTCLPTSEDNLPANDKTSCMRTYLGWDETMKGLTRTMWLRWDDEQIDTKNVVYDVRGCGQRRLWPDQDNEGSDTNRQRAAKEARIYFLCVHTNDVRRRQTLMKICVDATTNNKGQRWLHLRMQ